MAMRNLDPIELPDFHAQEQHRASHRDEAAMKNEGDNVFTNDMSQSDGDFHDRAGTLHSHTADESAKVRSKLKATAVMAALYVSPNLDFISNTNVKTR